MTAGPCLCGDPYCSSCGNPAAAAMADAMDSLHECIDLCISSHDEILFLNELIPTLLDNYRSVRDDSIKEARDPDLQYIDELKTQVAQLQDRLKYIISIVGDVDEE